MPTKNKTIQSAIKKIEEKNAGASNSALHEVLSTYYDELAQIKADAAVAAEEYRGSGKSDGPSVEVLVRYYQTAPQREAASKAHKEKQYKERQALQEYVTEQAKTLKTQAEDLILTVILQPQQETLQTFATSELQNFLRWHLRALQLAIHNHLVQNKALSSLSNAAIGALMDPKKPDLFFQHYETLLAQQNPFNQYLLLNALKAAIAPLTPEKIERYKTSCHNTLVGALKKHCTNQTLENIAKRLMKQATLKIPHSTQFSEEELRNEIYNDLKLHLVIGMDDMVENFIDHKVVILDDTLTKFQKALEENHSAQNQIIPEEYNKIQAVIDSLPAQNSWQFPTIRLSLIQVIFNNYCNKEDHNTAANALRHNLFTLAPANDRILFLNMLERHCDQATLAAFLRVEKEEGITLHGHIEKALVAKNQPKLTADEKEATLNALQACKIKAGISYPAPAAGSASSSSASSSSASGSRDSLWACPMQQPAGRGGETELQPRGKTLNEEWVIVDPLDAEAFDGAPHP